MKILSSFFFSPHKLPPNRQRQQRRLQRCEYLFQDYSSPQHVSGLRYSTFCKVAVVKLKVYFLQLIMLQSRI